VGRAVIPPCFALVPLDLENLLVALAGGSGEYRNFQILGSKITSSQPSLGRGEGEETNGQELREPSMHFQVFLLSIPVLDSLRNCDRGFWGRG
jgi:hypothetical protein